MPPTEKNKWEVLLLGVSPQSPTSGSSNPWNLRLDRLPDQTLSGVGRVTSQLTSGEESGDTAFVGLNTRAIGICVRCFEVALLRAERCVSEPSIHSGP